MHSGRGREEEEEAEGRASEQQQQRPVAEGRDSGSEIRPPPPLGGPKTVR